MCADLLSAKQDYQQSDVNIRAAEQSVTTTRHTNSDLQTTIVRTHPLPSAMASMQRARAVGVSQVMLRRMAVRQIAFCRNVQISAPKAACDVLG